MNYIYFTSESVTDGHPDKICDQIADAFVDEAIANDPKSKMAVEVSIKDNFVFIFGEANTKANIHYEEIASKILKEIGYEENFEFLVKVEKQSSQIFQAVDNGETVKAGDQGIMFGYASNESENLMPLAIDLAHKLAFELKQLRAQYDFLKPDGKTQVTVAYDQNFNPVYVHTVLVSASHDNSIEQKDLETFIIDKLIRKVIPRELLRESSRMIVNPSGAFSIYGPFSDSGTTGRKLVVDSYGGYAPIGGGAFSSKDPSKVDRSAAYYARYVAKNLVYHGFCDRCLIQLSYAIGLEDALSVHVDCFGTEKVSNSEMMEIIHNNFDFKVQNIINELDLLRPIYRKTANFGHFGRPGFPWEEIKKLKK